MNDHALLREFADAGSQTAFQELVERHVALVYSAARRRLGDAHLAEDATQQVFALLARKAARLPESVVLSGWLYRAGGLVAAEISRRERRRQQREALAAQAMNDLSPDATWREIEPLLDEAMDELGHADRDAVVLRYFENKSLREVGAALGVSEDAAQKRLTRALERLRSFLARRGKTVAVGALTGAIATGAVQAAPAGLAQSVASFVLTSAAVAASTSTIGSLMNLTAIKTIITGAVAVGGAAAIVVQHNNLSHLRVEQQATLSRAQAAEQAATNAQQALAAANATAQNDPRLAELVRLRGEVAALRRSQAELTTKNAQLTQAVQQSAAVKAQADQATAEKDALKEQAIAKMNYTKQWLLAFIMFAQDHNGQLPKTFQDANAYIQDANGNSPINQSGDLKPDQFEIMYQGALKAIQNPAQTILIREVQPFAGPDGAGMNRTYGFADGHVEVHHADNGDFGPWESTHLAATQGQ